MLREVREDDLDVLFEQQREPEAIAMAIFPAREREAFDAHWRRVLANDRNVVRAIEVDGEVAGNIGSWEQDGKQLVGYWLGRKFWGRGLATAALGEFVEELGVRPLHAWVAHEQRRLDPRAREVRLRRRSASAHHDVEELLFELAEHWLRSRTW